MDQKLSDFEEYQRYWRKVLVEILERPEAEFLIFRDRMEKRLATFGEDYFFHDSARKIVSRELLPPSLKKDFPGGDGIWAGNILMRQLVGNYVRRLDFDYICSDTFDIHASRERFQKMLKRLERLAQRRKEAELKDEKT